MRGRNVGFHDGARAIAGSTDTASWCVGIRLDPDARASIETHYMGPVIDTPASDALAQLLAGDLPAMSDAKKRVWARFLMSLALRNPETLAAVNAEMHQQLIAQLCANPEVQEVYRASGNMRGIAARIEDQYPATLERAGTLQLSLFIEELSKPFHAMRWFTFDLGGAATSLLTSDRPLFEHHGFGDARYVVALPLSPRRLFVAASARESIQALTRQTAAAIVGTIVLTSAAGAREYFVGGPC